MSVCRKSFWSAHVESHRNSGQSRSSYCESHQLNPDTFNRWIRRLNAEQSSFNLSMNEFQVIDVTPTSSQLKLDLGLLDQKTLGLLVMFFAERSKQ